MKMVKINLLRSILLFTFLLLFYSNSIAQHSIGVKTGWHLSKLHVDYGNSRSFGHDYDYDKTTGFEFGINLNTTISKNLGIISELNIIQKGGEQSDHLIVDQLELALLLAYDIPIKRFSFFVNAGGSAGYFVASRLVSTRFNRKIKYQFESVFNNRWDAAVALGGGVKYKFGKYSVVLETRYRRSFTQFDPIYKSDEEPGYLAYDHPPLISKNRLAGIGFTIGCNYQL